MAYSLELMSEGELRLIRAALRSHIARLERLRADLETEGFTVHLEPRLIIAERIIERLDALLD